jgi:hypothetical protein
LLLCFATGCAAPTAPPSSPVPAPSTTASPDGAVTRGEAPDVGPQPEAPDTLPPAIEAAEDETSRVVACMTWSHVDLITGIDRTDETLVLERLGQLRASKTICMALVDKFFEGFAPYLKLFREEWTFYETYFALMAEEFTVTDRVVRCQHFSQTDIAAQRAWQAARLYLSWLSGSAPKNTDSDPLLELMLLQGTQKVSALGRAARTLRRQFRAECPQTQR